MTRSASGSAHWIGDLGKGWFVHTVRLWLCSPLAQEVTSLPCRSLQLNREVAIQRNLCCGGSHVGLFEHGSRNISSNPTNFSFTLSLDGDTLFPFKNYYLLVIRVAKMKLIFTLFSQ